MFFPPCCLNLLRAGLYGAVFQRGIAAQSPVCFGTLVLLQLVEQLVIIRFFSLKTSRKIKQLSWKYSSQKDFSQCLFFLLLLDSFKTSWLCQPEPACPQSISEIFRSYRKPKVWPSFSIKSRSSVLCTAVLVYSQDFLAPFSHPKNSMTKQIREMQFLVLVSGFCITPENLIFSVNWKQYSC